MRVSRRPSKRQPTPPVGAPPTSLRHPSILPLVARTRGRGGTLHWSVTSHRQVVRASSEGEEFRVTTKDLERIEVEAHEKLGKLDTVRLKA